MANTYLITYPNSSQLSAQGVSISTNAVNIQTPPAVPTTFQMWQKRGNSTDVLFASFFSYTIPTIVDRGGGFVSGGFYWWYPRLTFQNPPGNTIIQNYTTNGTGWYLTPGYTTTNRCDVLITDSTGNILTITGQNNVACPTWTTTPDNECASTELKCPDPTDPRGFCCSPCDSLNSKIRALI